jgi:hypothetical protein
LIRGRRGQSKIVDAEVVVMDIATRQMHRRAIAVAGFAVVVAALAQHASASRSEIAHSSHRFAPPAAATLVRTVAGPDGSDQLQVGAARRLVHNDCALPQPPWRPPAQRRSSALKLAQSDD